MDASGLAAEIDGELRRRGNPERAEHDRAYLKSSIEHYGVPVPAIRAVARDVRRRLPDLAHDDLVALVEALWDGGPGPSREVVYDRRAVTVELLRGYGHLLDREDLPLVERLIRESGTWALVDGLAPWVAGPIVEADRGAADVLDRWAADPDFWVRRAALLALLVPLREGRGDFDRFGRYADAMLDEREFFIRKAIGWVLRDTARKRPDLVFEWLLPRASRASAVTLREALKPLSEAQKAQIRAGSTAS